MINILFISWIIVFIVDISGWTATWKRWLSLLLTNGKIGSIDYDLKPFSCSLCMTWWIGLIYLLIAGKFTIGYIAFLALVAAATRIEESIFNLLEDIIFSVIKRIEKLL